MKAPHKADASNVAPAEASQKFNAVKMAMDQIEKQYGKGSIMRLG